MCWGELNLGSDLGTSGTQPNPQMVDLGSGVWVQRQSLSKTATKEKIHATPPPLINQTPNHGSSDRELWVH